MARRRSTPCLPRLLAVVDRIDDDGSTESQVQVRHRADRLVRSDADVPTSRQATGEDRLLDSVDGQVHRPRARSDGLGNAGLPDAGKTRDHDEMPGQSIFSGMIEEI